MNVVNEYTQADIEKATILLARMMPLMMAGMTLKEAGEAIIMRDYELVAAAKADDEVGRMIRHELATQVYSQIRN